MVVYVYAFRWTDGHRGYGFIYFIRPISWCMFEYVLVIPHHGFHHKIGRIRPLSQCTNIMHIRVCTYNIQSHTYENKEKRTTIRTLCHTHMHNQGVSSLTVHGVQCYV